MPTGLFQRRRSPIRALDLSSNHLLSITTNAFVGLERSLLHLNLSHNHLGRAVEPIVRIRELRRLHSLRVLDLSSNGIKQLAPTFFDGDVDDGLRRSLVELNLADNDLDFLPPSLLRGMTSLRRLDLRGNRFVSLEGGILAQTSALRELRLDDNAIGEVEAGALSGTSLERLSLRNNRLKSLVSHVLAAVGATLEELDLSENLFEHLPPLRHLDRLKALNLSWNRLASAEGECR